MSVSVYKNNECKYSIDKLEKVVYLINEEALRNIHIDDGEAYITDIDQEPMSLSVYDIELLDADELDERYKFTHTLKFSMNGYVNYRDFEGRYYAIVKTVDGEYWLVNPLFPCKVTYTYTLDSNDSHTDFTLATISNHPTLRIHGMEHATPYECGYRRCTFKSLRLNETIYSLVTSNHVLYTNDGFKDIEYNNNSAVFTETFDGNNVQHKLDFNIKFDNYKDSWHYNLLEFTENRYAAIIGTSCNKFVLCGFGFGLQPTFNVTANDDMTMDNILISLVDTHDNGSFVSYQDEITVEKDGTTKWMYTTKYDGYECIGDGIARYLLKEEVDALMNPTGNYMCLVGYEEQFSFLNIVDTFTENVIFNSVECVDTCKLQSSFPLEFVFNKTMCRNYTLISDSDWSITSSASHITVTPSSGVGGESYTVGICNTLEPSETIVNSTLTVEYCNKTKVYNVEVKQGDDCLPAGSVFDISANGQYVTIPTSCCVKTVTDPSGIITSVIIQNSYVKVYAPQNDTGVVRQFILEFTYCDDKEGEVIINQSNGFEKWVKEDTACTGNQKCDVERKYTGTTAFDINTRTEETRLANCSPSEDCSSVTTRWIDTTETTCNGGKKYLIQIEQSSSDGGQTWVETGLKRLGNEVEDPNNECAGVETEEEWVQDGYVCEDTTKYVRERLYTRVVGTVDWIATDTYRRTNTVIETNSTDCGYVHPSETWKCEKWEIDNGYICEGTTKYAREQRYVRDCADCNNCNSEWIATGVYRRTTTVLETNSTDCGYIKGSDEWTCEKWEVVDDDYICEDSTKYTKERRYVRECEDCSDCSAPWIATDVYRRGSTVIELNSSDCGYDPTLSGNCTDYRDDGDTICNGFDKYKYLRKYVRNCSDCSNCNTSWTATSIYKQGTLVQANSVDCGYIPSGTYERWIVEGTICNGYDKFYLETKEISDDNIQWYKTNIHRRGSLIEATSFDCGYIPTENCYEWRNAGTLCNGFNKFNRLRKFISNDCVKWYETNIYKQGSLIEENSADCGYVPNIEYEYRWVETDSTKCVGTTKYYQYKKQRRRSDILGSQWEDVIPTVYSIDGDGTLQPRIAEVDSPDCGYVPPVEPTYQWFNMDITRYWICGDCGEEPTDLPKIEYRVVGGTVQRTTCNNNATLTSSDYGNVSNIEYAKIGACVTEIGQGAFSGTSLSQVLIPSTVTIIGNCAFSGCTALIDFSLPMSVTTIGASAFTNDIQLNKIMLPNSLTSIGDYALSGCKNFSSINIPSGITIIPTGCFYDCDGMTDIYLLENVRLIKSYAFGNCNGLVNFTCYALEPPAIYSNTFSNMNENLKIYVPAAVVDDYKAAWSAYADNIVAIGE